MSQDTTLYRKYRPQRLEDIVGQKHVTKTLRNAFLNNNLPHAFLFAGPRGCGKTTTAKILAKLVNCSNPQNGEPCNECQNCVSTDNGSNPDIVEMDAASNRGIENMRELTSKVDLKPSFGKKRVYIIDEVHMLTTESFNALLKTLEEPPESVMFILATTELNKVIGTITSRCQTHNFKRISVHDISELLEKVAKTEGNIKIDASGAEAIAINSGGSLRDALGKLQQIKDYAGGELITHEVVNEYLGVINNETLAKIIDLVISKDLVSILSFVGEMDRDGVDVSQLCVDLEEYLRKIWLIGVDSQNSQLFYSSDEELKKITEHSNSISPENALGYIEIVEDAMLKLHTNAIPRILLETTLTKMAYPDLDGGLVGIRRWLKNIDKRIIKLETVLEFFKK